MDFNGEDQNNPVQGKSKRDLIWERKKKLREQRLQQSELFLFGEKIKIYNVSVAKR